MSNAVAHTPHVPVLDVPRITAEGDTASDEEAGN